MLLAPSNGEELRDMIYFAARHDEGPVAIRYPRGGVGSEGLQLRGGQTGSSRARIKKLTSGKDLAIFTFGDMVPVARRVRELLLRHAASARRSSTCSPSSRWMCGASSGSCAPRGTPSPWRTACVRRGRREPPRVGRPALRNRILFCAGFPDCFVAHGTGSQLFKEHGLDAESLVRRILTLVK